MENPFNIGYYSTDELKTIGFKSIGENVKIAKNCTIIGIENITIGSNVRIDGYCTILAQEGSLKIGSYIHIASYCLLVAGDGIVLEDFSQISHGVRVFSRTDDFSGNHLTGPTISAKYKKIIKGAIVLKRHALIGSGAIVLPGVELGEGVAVGALSLINKNLGAWGIYAGCPAKKLKERSKHMLQLEKEYLLE